MNAFTHTLSDEKTEELDVCISDAMLRSLSHIATSYGVPPTTTAMRAIDVIAGGIRGVSPEGVAMHLRAVARVLEDITATGSVSDDVQRDLMTAGRRIEDDTARWTQKGGRA